jgi:hypothetical protein
MMGFLASLRLVLRAAAGAPHSSLTNSHCRRQCQRFQGKRRRFRPDFSKGRAARPSLSEKGGGEDRSALLRRFAIGFGVP